MSRSSSVRAGALWRLLLPALCLLFGLSSCSRGESEHFAKARELERKLLMKGGEVTYAAPEYLSVARELEQVPPWSSDHAKAREKLQRIQDARRLKAGEVFSLEYLPARLEGVSLASLAPPQPDAARPKRATPASIEPSSASAAPAPAASAPAEVPTAGAAAAAGAQTSSAPAPEAVATREAGKKDVKKQTKHKPVIVYTTSWCGYCRKARAYLSQRNVPFIDKDVEEDPAAAREMMEKAGYGGGVPVLDIDGTIIRGFDVRAIDAALARRSG